MLQISIHEEGAAARVVEFEEGQRVSFGRSADNDIVLVHNSISRSHGEFCFQQGSWQVIDRGSRAGMIIVQGSKREHLGSGLGDSRARLQGGEDVLILDTRLRVEIKSAEEHAAPPTVVSRVAETQLVQVPFFEPEKKREGVQLELLLDLAKDLNGATELDEVLARISSTVFVALEHATQVTFCVPDPGGAYTPEFGILRDGKRLRGGGVSVSSSIVERVVDNQSAMLFTTGDEHFDPSKSMIARQITSSMAVPLLGARGSVGVMVVDNRTLGTRFAESDLDLMIMLSNSAAFALERAQLQTQIEVLFEGFVDTAVTAIEARDPTTSGHSRRVASLTVSLAEIVTQHQNATWQSTGFDEEALTELAYSAMLHDFGKVGIPECLLAKAGKLYPEQLEAIVARFDLILAVSEIELIRREVARVASADADHVFGAVEQDLAPLRTQLAGTLAEIRQISMGDGIDDATTERLRGFGTRHFVDPQGNSQTFLTPYELASLCGGPGTLTQQQRSEVQRHVTHSFEVVRQIPWPVPLSRVPDLVHAHHEKLDGSGYPRGLRAPEIPTETRMLTLCDMFDAVTAFDRPYRAALSIEGALEFLRWEAGAGRIDGDLVKIFAEARVWEQPVQNPKLMRLLRLDSEERRG